MLRPRPFQSLGQWVTRVTRYSPMTNLYGLARTLLACATLATLVLNPVSVLFPPASGAPLPPQCDGASVSSVYCLAPTTEIGRVVSILVLVVAASGVLPRWTVIPHWWVTFSLQASATTIDGGDQVAAVLTLLLIPLGLCDGRRTHWDRPAGELEPGEDAGRLGRLVGHCAVVTIRVQAAVIYFHAGIAKFGVAEWADGTAMYYWLTDSTFGAPPWYAGLVELLVQNGSLLTLFTWSMMAGEVVLAFALFAPQRYWRYFLAGAIAFHLGIALVIGLVSFAAAMIALDILFLHPATRPLRLRATARRRSPSVQKVEVAQP